MVTDQDATQSLVAAQITATAAGRAKDFSDEDLHGMVTLERRRVVRARQDYELATAALIARNMRKDHPSADYIGLKIDGADELEIITGAIVYDAEDKKIGEYSTYDQDTEDDATDGDDKNEFVDITAKTIVVDHLPELTTDPFKAHWVTFSKNSNDEFDLTIDIEKAAAWKLAPMA